MEPETTLDAAVRRELLRLVMLNSACRVLLQRLEKVDARHFLRAHAVDEELVARPVAGVPTAAALALARIVGRVILLSLPENWDAVGSAMLLAW